MDRFAVQYRRATFNTQLYTTHCPVLIALTPSRHYKNLSYNVTNYTMATERDSVIEKEKLYKLALISVVLIFYTRSKQEVVMVT